MSRRHAYLQAMGIDVFVRPGGVVSRDTTPPVMPSDSLITEISGEVSSLTWDALRSRVQNCTACTLHTTRTQTVFGVGNRQAQVMFIGEAPGADEDAQGEPFVGRAGQLLNEMLRAIQFQRDQVYIANILKCRPPANRDPKPEEAAQCWPYLQRQIELIQPRLLVALGRIAAQRLLKTDTPLTRLRQKVHQHPESGVPMIVTYHPAYLLRTPQDKRKAWEDLLFLRRKLTEPGN